MKIICTTLLDTSILDIFNLPEPSINNTGGFRTRLINENNVSSIVFSYSPIDLCVAGLTQYYLNNKSDNNGHSPIVITNLSEWFIQNNDRIGEMWVTCTTLINGLIIAHNIIEWKILCKLDSRLHLLFKKNAPFTFRS